MSKEALFSTVFAGLYLVHACVLAGEVPFPQCPQQLPIQQSAYEHQTDGWKIVNNKTPQRLEGIAISSWEYPVIQTGFDVPTDERLSNGNLIGHYETGPDTSGEHDYWAVCVYMKSAVVLVQRLPENVRRCEVLYHNDVKIPDRITIKCFDTPRAEK
jgi:hypothetical protein